MTDTETKVLYIDTYDDQKCPHCSKAVVIETTRVRGGKVIGVKIQKTDQSQIQKNSAK